MRGTMVVVLVLGGLTSYPHAATVEHPSVTPLHCGKQGSVVLPVRLNGRGPFRFLLDTGSTHTAVTTKTAAAIDAPIVAKTRIGSVAGSREALVVRIDALDVGPLSLPGLLASVIELDGMNDIDGVIGHDALSDVRYTIDFRQRQLVWWPPAASVEHGNVIELESRNGRFLASLLQDRTVLRLVPDTGASSLLLVDPAQALPLTRLPSQATLTTTSAATAVQLARLRELRVGAVVLRNVPAVVVGRDQSEPADVDGLLPLHLFDRVTVDGPRKRLIIEKSRADSGLMFF
jgi:predicted aspartyl protease